MIFNKKLTTVIALLLVVVFLSLIVMPYEKITPASAENTIGQIIILDAGHAALENTID